MAVNNLPTRGARRQKSRTIWSCTECRRKKLRCDHARPACGRCTNIGKATQCKYTNAPRVESNSTQAGQRQPSKKQHMVADKLEGPAERDVSRPSTALIAPSRTQHVNLTAGSRTISNQSAIQDTSQVHASELRDPNSSPNSYPAPQLVRSKPIKGSAFKTRYRGRTCAHTIADRIAGFTTLTNDAIAMFPAFNHVTQFVGRYEIRAGQIVAGDVPNNEKSLKDLLPPKAEADELVQLYMRTIDHLYPILIPSAFEEYYAKIWLSDHNLEGRQVLVILLVVAVSYCIRNADKSVQIIEGLKARDKATIILDSCDHWLHTHIQAFDNIVDFQAIFLLLLGRLLNFKQYKRLWVQAGNVVRTYMCSGLHRDPSSMSRNLSSFYRETRRKLWIAAADLELQASFEHGMPASAWPLQREMNNERTDADAPTAAYTRESYLELTQSSLVLRHELNSILNDERDTMTYEQALSYTTRLRDMLGHVELHLSGRCSTAIKALLKINLHQYILSIHEQQLQGSAHASDTGKQSSRNIILGSALEMLDCHKVAVDSDNCLVEALMGDFVRIALSLCRAYITADPGRDRVFCAAMAHVGLQNMRELIDISSEVEVRSRGNKSQLWRVCAADALMKIKTDPDRRLIFVQEAVDLFTKPFYRLMSMTEDMQDLRVSSQMPRGNDLLEMNTQSEGNWTVLPEDFMNWMFDVWDADPIPTSS